MCNLSRNSSNVLSCCGARPLPSPSTALPSVMAGSTDAYQSGTHYLSMEGEAPTICRWKVIDAVMVYGQHHRHPRPTSRSSRPPSPRESAVVVPDRLPRPLGHRPRVACPADGKAWRVGVAVWEVGRWLPRCRIAASTARARCSISARPSTMKASRRSVTIPRICR